MSPRAAWRLERLGFTVYDYATGKVDWLAAGLPTVRAGRSPRRALDAADRDPPICSPDAVLDTCSGSVLVVNDHGVVLGRIPAGPGMTGEVAEEVMEPGPVTVRAHEPLDELLDRMRRRRLDEIVVTTPEGRLLGVLRLP
ncbi:MAG: CBS domain-containing protein [Acidimicrobiales bacterium]